jgi:hypothetical protein
MMRGVESMARTAVDFFRLTGGLRTGETHEEIKKRIEEIVDLEARLNAGGLRIMDAERLRRRLRQLKDIH